MRVREKELLAVGLLLLVAWSSGQHPPLPPIPSPVPGARR
jgi:hypothetical protein